MKPDLVCVWPSHIDYPLFRQFISDNRQRFDKVIVVFTDMHTGKDYRTWLKEHLAENAVFSIDSPEVRSGEDWRSVAVNHALSLSTNKWIWFTEQDFTPLPDLWEEIARLEDASVIGIKQGERLHPACLFIKRSLLERTSKDFGANPPEYDHFGRIQKDLEKMVLKIDAYTINPKFYEHLNGLSQNMYLLQIGQEPNHEPEKFKEYCQKCLQISLPIHSEIRELLEKYI